jgi:hypothetical protein
MRYWGKSGDAEKGPFTLDQLRAAERRGTLRWTAQVREESATDWTSLESLLGRGKIIRDPGDADKKALLREVGAKAQREKLRSSDLGLLVFLPGLVGTAVSFALIQVVGIGVAFTGVMVVGLAVWYRERFGPRT